MPPLTHSCSTSTYRCHNYPQKSLASFLKFSSFYLLLSVRLDLWDILRIKNDQVKRPILQRIKKMLAKKEKKVGYLYCSGSSHNLPWSKCQNIHIFGPSVTCRRSAARQKLFEGGETLWTFIKRGRLSPTLFRRFLTRNSGKWCYCTGSPLNYSIHTMHTCQYYVKPTSHI